MFLFLLRTIVVFACTFAMSALAHAQVVLPTSTQINDMQNTIGAGWGVVGEGRALAYEPANKRMAFVAQKTAAEDIVWHKAILADAADLPERNLAAVGRLSTPSTDVLTFSMVVIYEIENNSTTTRFVGLQTDWYVLSGATRLLFSVVTPLALEPTASAEDWANLLEHPYVSALPIFATPTTPCGICQQTCHAAYRFCLAIGQVNFDSDSELCYIGAAAAAILCTASGPWTLACWMLTAIGLDQCLIHVGTEFELATANCTFAHALCLAACPCP